MQSAVKLNALMPHSSSLLIYDAAGVSHPHPSSLNTNAPFLALLISQYPMDPTMCIKARQGIFQWE